MLGHKLKTLLLAGVVLPVVACAGNPQSTVNSSQPAASAASLSDAEVAQFHPLATGATYTIRKTMSDGSVETDAWKVLGPSEYRGKAVIRISDPSGSVVNVFNAANGNWMATIRDGKETVVVEPDIGSHDWPLKVGKSWEARFTYSDKERGKSWSPVVTEWTVAGIETVTVPAGTFKTFRLDGSPGRNNAVRATIWIDPKTGISVKQYIERLPYHYLGPGSETDELVEFHPPEK